MWEVVDAVKKYSNATDGNCYEINLRQIHGRQGKIVRNCVEKKNARNISRNALAAHALGHSVTSLLVSE